MTESIRLAHITDTHLGYRALNKVDQQTGRNQRTVDFEHALERAIDSILAAEVDGVIHAGDVFHHTRPTWHTMRHFIQQFRRLEDAGLSTLVIAGNHDTPRIRTGGSAYSVIELALPRTRFSTEYVDRHEYELFKHLNLHVHAIPHGALTNDDPVMPAVMSGRRNILVCHGMAAGVLQPGQHAEPGEVELDARILDPEFDYIALGHYHLHMAPAAKAWYAGSTERTGWGDYDATPGYAIVTLGDPGDPPRVEHIDIPARPMVNLRTVNGYGLGGREIADDVLGQLERAHQPDAMARVRIVESDPTDRREAESILRREADQFVWALTIAREAPVLDPAAQADGGATEIPDITQLFQQFVAGRTPEPYSEAFAARFLDVGGRALQEAIEADQPEPESDAVS